MRSMMRAIGNVIIYLIILFGLSTILFKILWAIWSTHDPLVGYLLTLIFTHLFLGSLDRLTKDQ